MKKKRFYALVLIALVILCASLTMNGVAMADDCVKTSIIGGGEVCDDGSGSSVRHILNLVVETMVIGVGILGVIGISITGIQYLTAGGNEEKVRKAKRRMFELVLGLAIYVVVFGVLQWLRVDPSETAPSISINSTNTGGGTQKRTSSASTRKATQTAVAVKKNNDGMDTTGTSANGRKVMRAAEEIAARMEKAGNIFYENNSYGIKNWNDIKTKRRTHCAQYVSIVLQEAGLIPKNKTFCLGYGRAVDCGGNNGSWSLKTDDSFKATYYSTPGKSIAYLVKNKKMVPGDVVGKGDGWHTMIYRGEKNGKYYFYSVGPQKENGKLVPFTKNWITNRVYPGDYMIGNVYHPK